MSAGGDEWPVGRRLDEIHDAFRALPEMDAHRWARERAEDDVLFGDDGPTGDRPA